jgi:hypothetical protein
VCKTNMTIVAPDRALKLLNSFEIVDGFHIDFVAAAVVIFDPLQRRGADYFRSPHHRH